MPPETPEQDFPFILVDGIRLYGREAGVMDQAEARDFTVSPESLFHITRHLARLSDEARQQLRSLVVSDGEQRRPADDVYIDAQMAAAGSKFHPQIDDPEKLVEFCRTMIKKQVTAGKTVPWMENPVTGEAEAQLVVEVGAEEKAAFGIAPEEHFGTLSLVKITPELAPHVRQEQRGQGEAKDRIIVNVVSGIPIPETDTLLIRLKKPQEGKAGMYTTYTGMLTPSLPSQEEQSSEEFAYNRDFWDRHAFVQG